MTEQETNYSVWPADQPFVVDRQGSGKVVIRFAPICDQRRTHELDDQLAGLIGEGRPIVCDLSGTVHIASPWLQWLAVLSNRARDEGVSLVLAGVSTENRTKADMIGLEEEFSFVTSVEEGLAQ